MFPVSPALLVNPPADGIDREPLASVDTAEPVLDTQHPFMAVKETNRASGAWRVRILSHHSAPAILYPNAMRLQARAVSEQGKSSFTWTHVVVAQTGEAKPITFRVHVNEGEPAAIEVFPSQTPSLAGDAVTPVKFNWPAA